VLGLRPDDLQKLLDRARCASSRWRNAVDAQRLAERWLPTVMRGLSEA
jgi:hypothetical protein